jgi:DNA-binding transcriptional LysR family regulator
MAIISTGVLTRQEQPMSELDDIRAFVEVAEAGGFGRAAKRLGLSKSVVSRRIARLETDLGTRLLSRTTRGISATETGLEFKVRAERILADLGEAREAVAHQAGEAIGLLRLSLPLAFGMRHVTPLLAELTTRYPRLEIEASYSDRFVDLIGERLDAAIRIGELKDSSLVARRFARGGAVVVASPDYLQRHGRPEIPEDLDHHDCLIYTGSADRDWRFQVGKRHVAIRPEGRLRADNGDAIQQAAKLGLGIAALPTFLASDAIHAGELVPLLTDYPMPEYGIYVVRPPGAHLPGKVRVLIDLLVERFEGEPRWDPCQMAALRASS